jgi:hypothetical protein
LFSSRPSSTKSASRGEQEVMRVPNTEYGSEGVRVDGDGALLDAKALSVGRGGDAFSPDAADRKLVVEIDQRGIGG